MKYSKFFGFLGLIAILQLPIYAKEPTKIQSTTIKTIKGEEIRVIKTSKGLTFKGYENKIVLLEFFGNSCPPDFTHKTLKPPINKGFT